MTERGPRRHRWAALAVIALVIGGCQATDQPTPRPIPGATPSAAASVAPPPLDGRLAGPLRDLTTNADWTGGAEPPLTVTKVRPSVDDLCIEVIGSGSSPLSVAVDVTRTPWTVRAVGTLPEGATEPVSFYERVPGEDAEACRFVLGADSGPWPSDPGVISVSGGYPDDAVIPAIQQAVLDNPAAFGIEPIGLPSLNVAPMFDCDAGPCQPVDEPAPGLVCLEGVVYQSGPVAAVALGLRRHGTEWTVESVRLTGQALAVVREAPPGGC